MWIHFNCSNKRNYLIKIYVDGINIIFGEPAVEDANTKLHRQVKPGKEGDASSLQDYVVVPQQCWIHGITDVDGATRQLIAMPSDIGSSARSQITGKGAVRDIQLETTQFIPPPSCFPYKGPALPGGTYQIFVMLPGGGTIPLRVNDNDTISLLMVRIDAATGLAPDRFRIVVAGQSLTQSMYPSPFSYLHGS